MPAGIALPAAVVLQIARLHEAIHTWIEVYDLSRYPVAPELPNKVLESTRQLVHHKLSKGRISDYREALSLANHGNIAIRSGEQFHARFTDILECLAQNPMAYAKVAMEQAKLLGLRTILTCEVQLIQSMISIWHDTPSPALDSVLVEVWRMFHAKQKIIAETTFYK